MAVGFHPINTRMRIKGDIENDRINHCFMVFQLAAWLR